MKKLSFHFYRNTHLFSKIIQWRTFSPYSHCSIEIDGYIYEAKEWKGVIKTKKRKNPPKSLVDTLEYKVPAKRLNEALEWLESQLGKGYDYMSLFQFFGVPKKRKRDDKFFCSELASEFASRLGVIEAQYFPTVPGGLFLLLK